MNVDVLHRLGTAVAERGPGAYVLTVSNDGRPHAVYVNVTGTTVVSSPKSATRRRRT